MNRSTTKLLLNVAFLALPVICHANGNGISTTASNPFNYENQTIGIVNNEAPAAFEPFTIAYLAQYGTHASALDISIDHNIIQAKVLTSTGGFTVLPPMWHVIDFEGLPAGDYSLEVHVEGTWQGQDSLPVLWRELDFSVNAKGATRTAYTFYHGNIERYFVTADQDEADYIQMSDAGWRKSDSGFNVWPAEGPAPASTKPVCRFYSYSVNSHFYTANAEECEYLQSFDSGWEFEGIAFRALVPIEQACYTGTEPVWRLYNNRANIRNSNHRFVASHETYRAMVADGWLGEGVAFCSPIASNPLTE